MGFLFRNKRNWNGKREKWITAWELLDKVSLCANAHWRHEFIFYCFLCVAGVYVPPGSGFRPGAPLPGTGYFPGNRKQLQQTYLFVYSGMFK